MFFMKGEGEWNQIRLQSAGKLRFWRIRVRVWQEKKAENSEEHSVSNDVKE